MQYKYCPRILARILVLMLVLVGVICPFSLNGCALLGPDYTEPSVNNPVTWNSHDDLTQVVTTDKVGVLSDLAWWHGFNDDTLNKLIIDALRNNNNIQQAIGNITQAQGMLQQIKMGWVPTLGGVLGYGSLGGFGNSNSAPIIGTNGAVDGGSVGGTSLYGLGLVPNYTINIFQQIKNQQSAGFSVMASKYAHDAVRLTVIGQVVGGYFTLVGQSYQLELLQQLVRDTLAQWDLAKGQYKAGYISLLALQQYEQAYYEALAQVPIIQNNIVISQNALQVLMNKNPGEIKNLANFTSIKIDGIIPINLPSTVLKNRPDVMQAEMELEVANANIGVATASYFPTISLTGALGTATGQLSGLFNPSSDFYQAQLAGAMPFLNLSLLGTINRAKGAYYTAYYNYILTLRNAFAQVDDGLSGHQKLTESYRVYAEKYNSSKIAYELGDQRFRQGADSLVTALSYKINMDNSAIILADIKLQQLKSIVMLYQALAGGYNVENTLDPKKFGDRHDV